MSDKRFEVCNKVKVNENNLYFARSGDGDGAVVHKGTNLTIASLPHFCSQCYKAILDEIKPRLAINSPEYIFAKIALFSL